MTWTRKRYFRWAVGFGFCGVVNTTILMLYKGWLSWILNFPASIVGFWFMYDAIKKARNVDS